MPDHYYMNQFIFTDAKGRLWYLLQREDGSVAYYFKWKDDKTCHFVFDDWNTTPPDDVAARAAMEAGE